MKLLPEGCEISSFREKSNFAVCVWMMSEFLMQTWVIFLLRFSLIHSDLKWTAASGIVGAGLVHPPSPHLATSPALLYSPWVFFYPSLVKEWQTWLKVTSTPVFWKTNPQYFLVSLHSPLQSPSLFFYILWAVWRLCGSAFRPDSLSGFFTFSSRTLLWMLHFSSCCYHIIYARQINAAWE